MKAAQSVIGKALRWTRRARGMAQEEFDVVSSRTYISELERGVRQPTVQKVDMLVATMQIHPLTLLTLSYCRIPSTVESTALLARVRDEINDLVAANAGDQ